MNKIIPSVIFNKTIAYERLLVKGFWEISAKVTCTYEDLLTDIAE